MGQKVRPALPALSTADFRKIPKKRPGRSFLPVFHSSRTFWDVFRYLKLQNALFGPKSVTCTSGTLGSTFQKKNVVSAAADVGHLRNRARNTRKLKI